MEEKSKFESELNTLKETAQKTKEEFEKQSKALELKLQEIMQKSLDEKIKKFDENSSKNLEQILKPFKENIESFKKKVEETNEHSTKRFAELSKQIEYVVKEAKEIAKEANELSNALASKKQMQGSWGEVILTTILEYSGLIKDIHYQTQLSYKDEDGKTKRPDVLIKLPHDKYIIIDSKVSLNDYKAFVNAKDEAEQNYYGKEVAKAFKNQIDNLASKDYTAYHDGTLEYVFMFVPIENAFNVAQAYDENLFEYAIKRHIALVTPSTLIVTLRTIYLYWQSENSNRYATKLFSEAGKLYDKLYGFVESFEKVGQNIQTLYNNYEKANSQLAKGRGNLLSKADNLVKLGAKTTKNLKNTKLDYDSFEIEDIQLIEETKEKKDE